AMSAYSGPECALGVTSETLSAWHDHMLSRDDVRRLSSHIASCRACQTRLTEYDALGRALQRERSPEPDERLWRDIFAGMQRPTRRLHLSPTSRRQAWSGLAGVAAVLLLVLGFTLLFRSLDHGPAFTGTPTASAGATNTPGATPSSTTLATPVPAASK